MQEIKVMRVENYLNRIDTTTNDPEKLTTNIYSIILEYSAYKEQLRHTSYSASEPVDLDKLFAPDCAQLLYSIKEKVTPAINNMYMGNDKYSRFINEFLYDPISAINHECEKVDKVCKSNYNEGNKELDKKILSAYNKNQLIKNEINGAREAYNELTHNKKDVFKEKQTLKLAWYTNYFNNGKPLTREPLDRNKGGFFENLFGTTSSQYKEFARRFESVSKEGPEKGDLDGLRQSAFQYLKHKFKKGGFECFDKNYTIDEDKIRKLDSTSQGRVRLCLQVLNAIDNTEKAIEDKMDPKEFEPNENFNYVNRDILNEAQFIGENSMANDEEIIDNNIYNDVLQSKSEKFQNQIKNDTEENFINNNDINIDDNNINTKELNN